MIEAATMNPEEMDIWDLFDSVERARMPRRTRKLVNELMDRTKTLLGTAVGIPYPR